MFSASTCAPEMHLSLRNSGARAYLCRMDYFKQLLDLLRTERQEDEAIYRKLNASLSVNDRRDAGLTWYPVAIRDTEPAKGDYITVELERTTNQDIQHQFRTGTSAALFSNHNRDQDRVEGVVNYVGNNKIKITLRTDELPEWSRNGKLGVDILFDDNSYDEMQNAIRQAIALNEKREEGKLVRILTGSQDPVFETYTSPVPFPSLNASQQEAVNKILSAEDLAIVHGPPGTGKTTTLVQAIKALVAKDKQQVLVVAPSNTAVDLLSEKLSDAGLNVLRIGNPARVSDRLQSLTMDHKMAEHTANKEIKKLKKQAGEFKDMAHKYKRNFGKAERDQRKALFDEARNIMKQVEKTEQYIVDDLLAKADVITATLIGANHYLVRERKFHTVVIDEAGQALEPATWVPVIKAKKLILAGDHLQLPPTVKSSEAARKGLTNTLLEKLVARYPQTVVMLNEQYRMNRLIMGYSAATFYDNQLKAHASVESHTLSNDEHPLQFIDTAGCGFEEKTSGNAISNPEEASFTISYLKQLAAEKQWEKAFPTVGIISPYRRQIDELKEMLQHTPELQPHLSRITVNTIDSFQGQERDMILISMTRSNNDNRIGFLSEIRRMNVAMTRARKKLVVVGDSGTLSQHDYYAGFIGYAEQHDAYKSAWEYMGV